MTTGQKELGDFLARIFPDVNKHGAGIWHIEKGASEDVKGAGLLVNDLPTLAARISTAAGNALTVHMGLSSYEVPKPDIGFHKRTNLTLAQRHVVVLDVDFKDNPGSEQDVIDRISNAGFPASGALRSSNGLHMYYIFNEDILPFTEDIHNELSTHMEKFSVIVDNMAGRSPRGVMRAPGSLGKCGSLLVWGSMDGPDYDRISLASQLSVPPFGYNKPKTAPSLVDERSMIERAMCSLQPVTQRSLLEKHCGAYRVFVQLAAATQFDAGLRGQYADARMFASIAAKAIELPDTSEQTRRDYAINTMLRWPGSTEEWVTGIYDGVTSFPAFKCDQWSPAYRNECTSCPHKQLNSNPVSIANEQSAQPPQPKGQTVAFTPTTTHVPAPGNVPGQLQFLTSTVNNMATVPDGYFIGNDGTLMLNGVKEVKGKPVPTCTPVCTPGFVVRTRSVQVAGNSLTGDQVHGYIVQAVNRLNCQYITNKVLNNPSALSDECSSMGILVKSHKLLQEFISQSVADMSRDNGTATALGWVDGNEKVIVPGYLISDNEAREISMSPSLENMLGADNKARGTLGAYINGVVQPLANEPSLFPHLFMLLTSFVCPVYSMVQSDSGPVISLVGSTSVGKTTAVKLGASVWHDPDRMTLTVDDTDAGRMSRISTMHHLPISFDEVTACDVDKLFRIIYMFTAGMDKAAMSEPGKQRAVGTWQSCIMASSNKPLRSLIAVKAADNGAVYDRVLDIVVSDNSQNDFNKQILTHCEKVARENRITPGVHWTNHLIRNRDSIKRNCFAFMAARQNVIANRFCARHMGIMDAVMHEFAVLGWMTNDQVTNMRSYLDGLYKTLDDRRAQLVSQSSVHIDDFLEFFQGGKVPRDLAGAQEMFSTIYPTGHAIPDMAHTLHEDDEGFYFSRPLIARYLKTMGMHNMTQQSLLDQWAQQLGVERIKAIRGRFPEPNILVAGPSLKVKYKQARRYKIPKVTTDEPE